MLPFHSFLSCEPQCFKSSTCLKQEERTTAKRTLDCFMQCGEMCLLRPLVREETEMALEGHASTINQGTDIKTTLSQIQRIAQDTVLCLILTGDDKLNGRIWV